MTLKIDGQSFFLQIGVWGCVTMFLVSFLTFAVAYFLMITKVAELNRPSEFSGYSFWERSGRCDSSFSRLFFFSPEIQGLRRLIYCAGTGAILSFGSLLSLVLIFGD
ncbi:hypothetical protein [Aquamicrobium soli]|jgi:hypothetical protein|uniref:Uncharacterized protein n=1 Tax=Aquamicrobium soli TaxID=1811518 RepID=A0ABV7K9L2_9HYPH